MGAARVVVLLAGLVASGGLACGSAGYPPAEPLAGEMTPEWREFAEQVDRACAVNFSAGQIELAQLEAESRDEGWSQRKAESLYRGIQAEHQRATHDEIKALGQPPAKPRLFKRWLANVERRAELMEQASRGWAEGDLGSVSNASARILGLKVDADWMARHFGLTICPSNGPSQSARDDYLANVNAVCADRVALVQRLLRQGRFGADAAAGTSIGETLQIAGIGVPDAQWPVRRRILKIKRATDRDQVRTIERAVRSPDPKSWDKVRDALASRVVHARSKLAALGMPACAPLEDVLPRADTGTPAAAGSRP